MEELAHRLIHEKCNNTEHHPKPSEVFARHFGDEHGVDFCLRSVVVTLRCRSRMGTGSDLAVLSTNGYEGCSRDDATSTCTLSRLLTGLLGVPPQIGDLRASKIIARIAMQLAK